MDKLLRVTISGIKNIEKEISLTFSNATINNGVKNLNNVKGIFGYNGAGKSAIITAIDIYKNIVTDTSFLQQNEVKDELVKLVNFKTKELKLSFVYNYIHNDSESLVYKHSITLSRKKTFDYYYIKDESLSLLNDRTLTGNYTDILVKKDNRITFIQKKLSSPFLDELLNADLELSSIIPYLLKRRATVDGDAKESIIEKFLFYIYLNANNMHVLLSQSDRHRGYKMDYETITRLIKEFDVDKENYFGNDNDLYLDETIIPKEILSKYNKENKRLERFIRFFKPDLKSIVFKKRDDGKRIHVRRIFVYENYEVEYEFESSGIKQLVKLFSYLQKCADGAFVFIDEIDTNLNTAYFEKLILFFANYGKGLLVFTTHNVEAMSALKKQSKSILVLGANNIIDVWIPRGNRSPINDYLEGKFPNSPMNIEDFDFVNIFMGED